MKFHDDGFSFTIRGESRHVEWVRVREITGYRKPGDEGGLLCVGLRVDAGGEYIEIHEEMEVYAELLEHLYDSFSGIRRNWWHEIASEYGKNRIVLHGIALGEESPAEKYLSRRREKRQVSARELKRWFWSGVGIVLLAALQLILARFISSWENSQWDDIIAIALLPMILAVISCRYWGLPRVFFMQLVGFYLSQLILVLVFDIRSPSLMGRFLNMEFYYLMFLGIMILAGFGVMMIPTNRAAGKK